MISAGLAEIVVACGPGDQDRLLSEPDEPMTDAAGKQTANTREASSTYDDKVHPLLSSDIHDRLRNSAHQRSAIDAANLDAESGQLVDSAFHQFLRIAGEPWLPYSAPGTRAFAHVKDKDFCKRGTSDVPGGADRRPRLGPAIDR
jgi:hypothetical protein